jgi:hypothetical protein
MTGVAELDEVDYDLEVDGASVRRTVHRRVFEHGGWATVAIVFQERDPKADDWKPAKLALVRLQRVHDAWKKHATITLRGDDALGLAAALAEWRDSFTA